MKADKKDIPPRLSAETKPDLLYHIRSEEMQEIIGRMPSWIIRCGIGVIALLIVAVFAGVAFIRFPETLACPVIIAAKEPSTLVYTAGNTRIQELLVKEEEQVVKGTPLIVLDNPIAAYDAILEVKRIAQAIDTCSQVQKIIKELLPARHVFSGKLQRAFAQLLTAARSCPGDGDYGRQQELRLMARKLLELCDNWEEQYLLRSTAAGKLLFFKPWYANAGLRSGEPILAIVRPSDRGFMVTGSIPAAARFEVLIGQTILLSPEGYDSQRSGVLRGTLGSVSSLPINGMYTVIITLDNGLETTAGQKIACFTELKAAGEILLQDKSILQRLFGSWNNSKP